MIKKTVKKVLSFIIIFVGLGAMIGFAAANNSLAGTASIFAAAFLTAFIATR